MIDRGFLGEMSGENLEIDGFFLETWRFSIFSGGNLEVLGVSEDFLWMKIVFWLASGCI